MTEPKNDIGYFDRPQTKRMLWIVLFVLCGISVFLELFVHRYSHFGDHGWQSMDGKFGFYALMGFVASAALVFLAKVLGYFLKVKEDFYDGTE